METPTSGNAVSHLFANPSSVLQFARGSLWFHHTFIRVARWPPSAKEIFSKWTRVLSDGKIWADFLSLEKCWRCAQFKLNLYEICSPGRGESIVSVFVRNGACLMVEKCDWKFSFFCSQLTKQEEKKVSSERKQKKEDRQTRRIQRQ